jgi:uncharacterized protein YgbK (DUF1537 family)
MAATASRMVTIIADDLTGACDTGCLFAGPGPVGVVVEPALTSGDRPVLTVDTESRRLLPDEAAGAVRAAAERLGRRLAAGPVFKKIDSTMRGAVTAELSALLERGVFSGALVCPAFPAQRRIVTHGRLLVDSVPVHESPIGRDAAFRGASSELAALLGGGAPVWSLGLDEVRGGCEKIAHVLERHPGAIVAADAETDADLASLAEAIVSVPGTLGAGSAGLGRALSAVLGLTSPAVALPPGAARLFVVGSLHPASRAQLDGLADAGLPGVRVNAHGDPDEAPAIAALASGRPAFVASATTPASPEAMARRVAQATARILERARPDLVAVTGGETAHALIQALRPERFDLVGAPADGLALGRLTMTDAREIAVVTKAGGFGGAGLLATILGGTR